jgi:glycosyltransferase involved in cell wall biosynthesis
MEPRVLVVIPAFNEEATIAEILLGLQEFAPEFDRLVINDGSKDKTGSIVDEMGEKQLRLPVNLGYGLALQTGLKYGLIQGYQILVSMDADGQHRPEDVKRLVDFMTENAADVVIGSRYCEGRPYSHQRSRRIGQLLFSHITKFIIGSRIYDTSSGFKAIRANVCEELVCGTFLDFHTESLVKLNLANYKIIEYPILERERSFGESMHSWTSMFEYPIKTLFLIMVALVDAQLIRKLR